MNNDLRTSAAYARCAVTSGKLCVPFPGVHPCFSLFIIEGRRFVSEDRNEGDLYDTIRLESRSQNTENLSISKAAAFLLNVLQQARDEGEPY
ncbi:hypothetical protein cypCar_00001062 [Cyprinus carpio]|nr:hypothetical protein cypCar_00001062 [Cyprinus carpio]